MFVARKHVLTRVPREARCALALPSRLVASAVPTARVEHRAAFAAPAGLAHDRSTRMDGGRGYKSQTYDGGVAHRDMQERAEIEHAVVSGVCGMCGTKPDLSSIQFLEKVTCPCRSAAYIDRRAHPSKLLASSRDMPASRHEGPSSDGIKSNPTDNGIKSTRNRYCNGMQGD